MPTRGAARLSGPLRRGMGGATTAEAQDSIAQSLSRSSSRTKRFPGKRPSTLLRRGPSDMHLELMEGMDRNRDIKGTIDLTKTPKFEVVEKPTDVAELATGLRSVLRRPGVHLVSPIESNPTLDLLASDFRHINQPDEINKTSIPPFVTSSRDKKLRSLAEEHNCKIMTSTSSSTGILSHFHFNLMGYRPHSLGSFSDVFQEFPNSFTRSTKMPSNLLMRNRKGIWGLDNCPKPSPPPNQILIDLGKSLERMYTMEPEDFKTIMLKAHQKKGQQGPKAMEPAMYTKLGDWMFRAQLDCQDKSLETEAGGQKSVFDLKTRAVLPIRLDVKNHKKYTDYHINAFNGILYSYEREFFDMVRSTLLKYALQCRIGDMGGILVGYHNTCQNFGFEYVALNRMYKHLYGDEERADICFDASTHLSGLVLKKAQELAAAADVPPSQIRIMVQGPERRSRKNNPPRAIDFFIEMLPEHQYRDHPDPAVVQHYASFTVDGMSKVELKAKLREMGLATSGVRHEMVSRLEGALVPGQHVPLPSLIFFKNAILQGRMKHFKMTSTMSYKGKPFNTMHDLPDAMRAQNDSPENRRQRTVDLASKTDETAKDLTYTELKMELKLRNQSTKGKKKILAERLAVYHRQQADNNPKVVPEEPESSKHYEPRAEDYRNGLAIDYKMTCIEDPAMSGLSAKRFWDMLCATWDEDSEEEHSLRIQQQIPMNGERAAAETGESLESDSDEVVQSDNL